MNKFRLFIENFLVYGLGGIISKIIPLLMIPLITRIMPTSQYFGLYDLYNTVVSFASAIAVFGMYDAMYRMFFDNDNLKYKQSVCSTAFYFSLIISVIVCVLLFSFKEYIAIYFFGDEKYIFLVYYCGISTLVGATNSLISAPTRMENKRKIFLITNKSIII